MINKEHLKISISESYFAELLLVWISCNILCESQECVERCLHFGFIFLVNQESSKIEK